MYLRQFHNATFVQVLQSVPMLAGTFMRSIAARNIGNVFADRATAESGNCKLASSTVEHSHTERTVLLLLLLVVVARVFEPRLMRCFCD